jgi:transcriptional regulatory protein LevR
MRSCLDFSQMVANSMIAYVSACITGIGTAAVVRII